MSIRNILLGDDLSNKTLHIHLPDDTWEQIISSTEAEGRERVFMSTSTYDIQMCWSSTRFWIEYYISLAPKTGAHTHFYFHYSSADWGTDVNLTELQLPNDFGTITDIDTDCILSKYFYTDIEDEDLTITLSYIINDENAPRDTISFTGNNNISLLSNYIANTLSPELVQELYVSGNASGNLENIESAWFSGCENVTKIELLYLNTTNVESFKKMFSGCSSLTDLDLTILDTENIKSIAYMFEDCSNLKALNLDNFYMDNLIDMEGLFKGCDSLTNVMINNLNTSNITNMNSVFEECAALQILDLSNWEVANVTSSSNMFKNCSDLETLYINEMENAVAADSEDMFYGCTSLPGYNSNEVTAASMSNYIIEFDEDAAIIFTYTGNNTSYPFGRVVFQGEDNCEQLRSWITNIYGDGEYNSTSRLLTGRLEGIGYGSAEDLFFDCTKLNTINVIDFNTTNITNMDFMFDNCRSIQEFDLSTWDVSNVTTMVDMFYGCELITELDLSTWTTTSLENMQDMFQAMTALESINLSSFDTSKVTNIGWMFYDCPNLKSIDLTNFDISNVDTIQCLFYGCSSLESIDISTWTNNKCDYFESMFEGCSSLKMIDISKLNMDLAHSLYSMFEGDTSLITIYCNYDFSSLAEGYSSRNMFKNCASLVGAAPFNPLKTDASMANSDTGYFVFKGDFEFNKNQVGGIILNDTEVAKAYFNKQKVYDLGNYLIEYNYDEEEEA